MIQSLLSQLPNFNRRFDERKRSHFEQSHGIAGNVTLMLIIGLFVYHRFHDDRIDNELFALLLTFIVVFTVALIWHRLRN